MNGTKSKLCYGVDASANELIIVRATRKGKRVQHSVVTSGENEQALVAMREDTRKGRATVAASMGVRDSFTRWLKTPFTSKAKARRVLPTLLDIQLPFPLESCLYDFLELNRTREGEIDALAVAARREGIDACLQQYADAGLQPDILDHEGLALWTQSIDELPLERGGRRIVAYLGHQHSAIALGDDTGFKVSHAAKYAYPEKTDTGGAVSSFVTRCRQALRAQFPEDAAVPIQWMWTGPGADDAQVTQVLESALQSETPLTFSKHREATSFLARALATRALTRGPLRCNLMSNVQASPEQAKLQDRAERRTAMAYAATGLVLCLLNVAWTFNLEHQNDQARENIAALAAELTGAAYSPSWRGQEVLIVERSLPKRMANMEPFSFAFGPSLTGALGKLLAASRDSDIALDKLVVQQDLVQLQGSAKDWDSCQDLVQVLRELGYEPTLDRSDAVADERVHFTLEGIVQP